ncbi:DUF3298 domain-containing protein [Sporosarcina sp. PTS2304]|uniref:RsiV family protein n=1 Tax=Sporosarcina sp. PTS2304 TaxID=2283194 RepID=UPI000E0D617E|nr:RsiV family protein [Sporosarcina sp. PTS2304]AXI00781.1 DUF3298 domain-containing protein [Sporosarcina sp. PTS2304]
MKNVYRLKKNYDEIEIPPELENVVSAAILEAKNSRKKHVVFKRVSLSAVAAAALFIGSINVSPAFAQSMIHLPVVGPIVEVFTIQTYTVDEERFQAELHVPALSGVGDKQLENFLNKKYIEENKKLFEQFEQQMSEETEGYFGVDTSYEIKTETDQIFSIARYEVSTAGSATESIQHDTIDKQNHVLLTLPSLFIDDQYVDVITSYISEDMKRQMARDPNLIYYPMDEPDAYVTSIDAKQDFYITAHHTLVISFDEYEVAAGLMGPVEFEIPSEILKDLLVSDVYIR